jgi:alkylation response protein AidB-like acyl-CoA dehydrogenase
MDFAFGQEQRDWQKRAREFAEREIRPISLARDRVADPRETFDWEIIRKGSKLGFRTAVVGKEWGGHGIDFVTQALVMAELAKGDSAVAKTFSQCWKWSHLIAKMCSEDQKRRFLGPFLADDTYLLAYGSTEPTAGSDNRLPPENDPKAGLRLRAERDGDCWILNGDKVFIANGSVAKLIFLNVRTDPNAPLARGTSLFIVPIGTPGFRIGKVFNKSGWRFYQNAELIFEDARVPHANLVGEVNGAHRGSTGDSSGDLFGDLELAANALGVCEAACEQAVDLARTHSRGGSPLKGQQLVQLKFGRMVMLTEALRSYVMRAAWEHDQKMPSANAGLAMNFSTDVIQEVTELNLDLHATAGRGMDPAADKLVRDSFIWSHLAGDAVQRMKIARRIVK